MTDPLIPSEALEGLMVKAFVEQAFAPGLFWDALLNAHLFVPINEELMGKEKEPVPEGAAEELPVLLGVDADGKQVIWLFTSPQVMAEYTEQDLKYRAVLAPRLFASLKSSVHSIVLIGPDSLTLSLHPDLVRSLSERKVPEALEHEVREVPKEANVLVGKPEGDLSALEACLSQLFSQMPEVTEACFIQIAYEEEPRLLLGLRLLDSSREKLRLVAEAVAKASEGVLEKGSEMDITLMDLSLKKAFAKWGTSFFKR